MPYLVLASVAFGLGIYFFSQRKRGSQPKQRGSDKRRTDTLTSQQKRFIMYAITLESQQVQLYKRFAKKARKTGKDHLAVGFETAMEVEATHLMKLRQEAKKRGIKNTIWSRIGYGLGRISGRIFSAFSSRVPLMTVVTIEGKAASDYSKAREGLEDQTLLDLYMVFQVDEEYHAAWAKAMLDHPERLAK